MNKRCAVLILSSIALFLSCSPSSLTGGSSQQGNGRIMGRVLSPAGQPSADVVVRVRQSTYVQPVGLAKKTAAVKLDAWTDSAGRFSIAGIDPGPYLLEADDQDSAAASIAVVVDNTHDSVRLGDMNLKRYARISGVVDTAGRGQRTLFVQVRGLEHLVQATADGGFTLVNLPEGSFDLRIVAGDSSAAAVEVANVRVLSGVTTSVTVPAGWRQVRLLYLNTTASGAQVSGDVRNFPVLIRLDRSTISFGNAKRNGDDIRFTKSDGTFLPYEIERWDSANGQAEIWVKVDTVYGNSAAQYVKMYWGNAQASAVSNPAAVFDTASGFQGVWHLAEAGNATAIDATGNHYDGTPSSPPPSVAQGVIGGAQQFYGVSNYIEMAGTANSTLNFPAGSSYMVSAWVKVDTLDNAGDVIACKDWFHYSLHVGDYNTWEFNVFKDRAGWERSASAATAGVWTLIAGVRSGNSQYLYVNGVCTDSTKNILIQSTDTIRSTCNLQIGRTSNQVNNLPYYMKGCIDEVRIMSVKPSADWLMLLYMNQKPNDALVVYK